MYLLSLRLGNVKLTVVRSFVTSFKNYSLEIFEKYNDFFQDAIKAIPYRLRVRDSKVFAQKTKNIRNRKENFVGFFETKFLNRC